MVTPTLPYHVAGPNDVQFVDAIHSTMQQAFGFTPFAWQEDVLTCLLKMSSCRHPVAPAPTFLCQPTGGGKSLIPDIYTAGRGGVSWCIGPLLALRTNQESKINKHSLLQDGRTFAIHLDAYCSQSQQIGIWNELNKYTRQSNLLVIVLSSPQVICSSDLVQEMFSDLLDQNALQLLCIDEAHLFVQFGLYFQDEFLQIKQLVFTKCLMGTNPRCPKIPVLFLMVISTKTILHQLESFTGFEVAMEDVFWPPVPLMLKPKVLCPFSSHLAL
jgi:superfamily II DNA helicase RecQ